MPPPGYFWSLPLVSVWTGRAAVRSPLEERVLRERRGGPRVERYARPPGKENCTSVIMRRGFSVRWAPLESPACERFRFQGFRFQADIVGLRCHHVMREIAVVMCDGSPRMSNVLKQISERSPEWSCVNATIATKRRS
eukprot:8204286-Pyramimonas_sp.AAC.1